MAFVHWGPHYRNTYYTCYYFIIHVIHVVHLFFHSSKFSELPQSIHHSYKPIRIYRQYYTLSKRPISSKLGIQQINLMKFTISSIILVKNFSLVKFLAPEPRFMPNLKTIPYLLINFSLYQAIIFSVQENCCLSFNMSVCCDWS